MYAKHPATLTKRLHTGEDLRTRGSCLPCGYTRDEVLPPYSEEVSTRKWRCEGGELVLRGDGLGYNDGLQFISAQECPECGWKVQPWRRIFAPSTADGTADQVVEWDLSEQLDMDDIRGGAGDELEYDSVTDMFRFDLGTGPGPMCYVTNPRPGDPLEGAKIVYRMADTTWE